jgi:hypothetical protein
MCTESFLPHPFQFYRTKHPSTFKALVAVLSFNKTHFKPAFEYDHDPFPSTTSHDRPTKMRLNICFLSASPTFQWPFTAWLSDSLNLAVITVSLNYLDSIVSDIFGYLNKSRNSLLCKSINMVTKICSPVTRSDMSKKIQFSSVERKSQ